ncbi:MAG: hypothetical protein ACT4P1_12360 [Sporichthyaceae bacterium]
MLLGTRRIVQFHDPHSGALAVILRCYCGTEVAADAAPPQHDAGRPSSRVSIPVPVGAAAG